MPPLRALLPLLVLAACAPPAETPAFSTRDSAGITIAENVMASVTASCTLDPVPVVRIGGKEDSDDYFLYRVMGTSRLSDGRIAVVNQGTQEVRWYDSTGVLVGRAGREGRGPGEFTSAYLMIRMPGDTLWVGDYRPWQWHIFGPDMTFVRSVVTTPSEINGPDIYAVFDDGQQVFGTSRVGQRVSWAMDSVTIKRFTPDGILRDTVVSVPTGRMGQTVDDPGSVWMRPWFEGSAQSEGSGDRLVVATWGESELVVYQVGEQVMPSLIIRWTTGDRTVTDAAVAAAREEIANRYPDLTPEMKAQMVDPLISTKRPAADRYPAVTRIVMGTDGRIWVRGQRSAGATTHEWIAFSREGRAVCRAELPEVEYLYEFGPDYMLAHERDSLGVETVVQYRLHNPND